MTGLLFDPGVPPPGSAPTWFGGGTPTQRRQVALGMHPLGAPLGPLDSTCGACVHFVRFSRSKCYFKCELRATRCRATDIAKRWRGCVEFARRSDAEQAPTIFAPD